MIKLPFGPSIVYKSIMALLIFSTFFPDPNDSSQTDLVKFCYYLFTMYKVIDLAYESYIFSLCFPIGSFLVLILFKFQNFKFDANNSLLNPLIDFFYE